MSNDGKHHFHLKEYSILQLFYAGTLQAQKFAGTKVLESNTPSEGNGITGIPSAVFLMRWEIKRRRKWELKRRKHLRKLSQLDAFSFKKNV